MKLPAALLIGLSWVPAVATAQTATTLPVPGQSAKSLAHRIVAHREPRFRLTPDDAKRRLIQSLIGQIRAYKPNSCDPAISACRIAAESLATQKAAEYTALTDAAWEEGYAALLESKLSPKDMAAASAFVASTSGDKFASAMTDSEMPPMIVLSYVSRRTQDFEDSLYDLFLQEAAAMPRRILKVPPPVWPSGQKRP